MARERYLVGSGEETIHQNEIVLTSKKDIRKNWWHYHKTIVFAILIGLAVVCSFVYSVVTRVKPDYQIGILTTAAWPDNAVEELESYLEQYADDRNGDGKIIVQLNTYALGSPDTADANVQQAAVVKFSADCTTGDSMIFLHDEASFDYVKQSGMEGFWLYKDGRDMPADKTDYENAMYSWKEVGALANFHVVNTGDDGITSADYDILLERYRLSMRANSGATAEKRESNTYYADSLALFHRLLKNEKMHNGTSSEGTEASQ